MINHGKICPTLYFVKKNCERKCTMCFLVHIDEIDVSRIVGHIIVSSPMVIGLKMNRRQGWKIFLKTSLDNYPGAFSLLRPIFWRPLREPFFPPFPFPLWLFVHHFYNWNWYPKTETKNVQERRRQIQIQPNS